MWCPSCRADVAAELSKDNRRMMCARCQAELAVASTSSSAGSKVPGSAEMERDARDLLSRWSSQSLLEPPATISSPVAQFATATETLLPKFDSSLVTSVISGATAGAAVLSAEVLSAKSNSSIPMTRHEPASGLPGAFDGHSQSTNSIPDLNSIHSTTVTDDHTVHAGMPHQTRRRNRLVTTIGQICAYSGVALLTGGSVLVMWSFFGGPSNYMPTGWLAAAVGQMLLFLGVVTLISSGMEQTIAEVTWRIDHLAEEVHHMGLALDDLEKEQRQHRLGQVDGAASSSETSIRKAA